MLVGKKQVYTLYIKYAQAVGHNCYKKKCSFWSFILIKIKIIKGTLLYYIHDLIEFLLKYTHPRSLLYILVSKGEDEG